MARRPYDFSGDPNMDYLDQIQQDQQPADFSDTIFANMPDQPTSLANLFDTLPDKPRVPSQPVPNQSVQSPHEQTKLQWLIDQGIRTLPMLAGGALGAATAEVTGPFGAMAGSGLGASLGSVMGDWYEGRPVNWKETAVEGGLGMLPGFGEVPGKGAGIRALMEYAGKQGATGALQGALGSYPRHVATTGDWGLPSGQETFGQAAGGAAFGTLFGAGHGAYGLAYGKPHVPTSVPKPTEGVIDPRAPGIPPPNIDPALTAQMAHPGEVQPQINEPGPYLPNGMPERIVRPSLNEHQQKFWMKRGYVFGGKDPNGDFMVYAGDPNAPPVGFTPATATINPESGNAPTNEPITFNNEDGLILPKEYLTDGKTITALRRQGYEMVGTTTDGQGIFRLSEEANRTISTEEPSNEPLAQRVTLDDVRAGLRQTLGREPTDQEVQQRAFQQSAEMPSELHQNQGEVTPFEPPSTLDESMKALNAVSSDIPRNPPHTESFPEFLARTKGLSNDDSLQLPDHILRNYITEYRQSQGRDPLTGGMSNQPTKTQTHERDWQNAYNEAVKVGIDPSKYKKLNELEWDIESLKSKKPTDPNAPKAEGLGRDQIINKFRTGLKPTNNPDNGRFILPDGTLLSHSGIGEYHEAIARKLGVDLSDAIDAGIIRFRANTGAEIHGPITEAQAKTISDMIKMSGGGRFDAYESKFYLDVRDRNGDLAARDINGKTSTTSIRNWVNSFFGEEGSGEPALQRGSRVKALESELSDAFNRRDSKAVEELSVRAADLLNKPEKEQVPLFARVQGGGYTGSMNAARGILNLSKEYSSPISGIVVREGLQNAMDAAERLGTNGVVKVRINLDNKNTGKHPVIEIYDNGAGMDDATVGEKLFDVFSTGDEKVNDPTAVGGKGIGSASYIFGAEHFEVDTVAVDRTDGRKYRIVSGGTPDQFQNPGTGSTFSREPVLESTPTYTKIQVTLRPDQHPGHSITMLRNIANHTRDRQAKIMIDATGMNTDGHHIADLNKAVGAEERTFPSSKTDKVVADYTFKKDNEIKIQIPAFDPTQERRLINVHYLNNGMYQFSRAEGFESAKGIPPDVIVNIHPLVDEMHEKYPFTNTREHLKDDIQESITAKIKKDIGGPAVERKKNRTQELYDSMPVVNIPGAFRKTTIYDPGQRLTPAETDFLVKSPIVHELVHHFDTYVDDIINHSGHREWGNTLEGIGLVMDPDLHGVHIPNPTTGKSTILFNPWLRMDLGLSPKDAAFGASGTGLHEVAHIGDTGGEQIVWKASDELHPRYREYVNKYFDELTKHGDLYGSTGHGMGFMHRLGLIYASYGPERFFANANRLENIYTQGSQSGRYDPKVQGLLQLYKTSRGRAETSEDLLSGTGVKQANQPPGGSGNVSGNGPPNGGGTTPIASPEKPPSKIREAYNLSRSLTTPLDLSASMRQGLPLITRKEWWTSWKQQLESLGSQQAFRKTVDDIKARPLFQSRFDPVTRKVQKSWAELAGIRIMDVGDKPTAREESMASTWAETGQMFGKNNAVQGLYKGTIGRAVKATNRAYTAYLNQLRADTFESLLKDSFADFKAGLKDAKNPYTDLPFAREIGDFVNTATGRGPLKIARPTITPEGKLGLNEANFEQHAKLLTDIIFSPRLAASRVRMLNPGTYMMASPFVRKQYLKAAISTAGAWGTISGLAYMAGANVSLDPDSADFGKIRIGNTRIDPAAGFQQYLVAASRLISGHTTSSASGRDFELGQGYRPPTRMDVMQNFASNKLHPVLKFAYDMANASQHQPFNVGDRLLQMYIPLIVGDVMDLAKEDPGLLPLIAPIATGMGSQTYDKGQTQSKFWPKKYDYSFQGGGF